MRSKYMIYTALVCRHCRRIQVIKGKGSWCDMGDPFEGLDQIISPVITSCWSCIQDDEMTYLSMSSFELEYDTEMELVRKYIGEPPTLMIVTDNPRFEESTETIPSTGNEQYNNKVMIVPLKDIVRGVRYEYDIYSITSGGIGDPHSNFLKEGVQEKHVEEARPTPFKCNTVLLCPNCERNVVFTGFVSIHPLGDRIYDPDELSELFFTGCKQCKDVNNVSDEDQAVQVAKMMLTGSQTIPRIREYFPTLLKMPTLQRNARGKIEILHRSRVASMLYHHCEMWSINTKESNSRRESVPSDFI